MNALANAIQSEGLVGTADGIVAALGAVVLVRPAVVNWSYKGLAIKFGREAVGMIDETLKAIPGLDWVRLSLASTDGLDFAAEETQAGLKALRDAGALSREVAEGLLALGSESKKRFAVIGLESLPTVEAVEIALQQIENVEWILGTLEPAIATLKAGGGSLAGTKKAIAELIESN